MSQSLSPPAAPAGPTAPPRRGRHPGGAPLLPPVAAYSLLTVLAVVVPSVASGTAGWNSDPVLLNVYAHHHWAVRAQALLTMAAAVPLAVAAAIFSDRIRQSGLRVPGRVIALAGGVAAAVVLAVAGALDLALLSPHAQRDVALLEFGHGLGVALGGVGFAAFAGLLIAGLAVTGLLGGILPRPLAWAGIGLAVLSQLALLAVVTDRALPVLPIARFAGIAWLLGAAATMRARAPRAPRAPRPPRPAAS